MYRNFIKLVSETVDVAHSNGINLFYESLEDNINKDLYIEENGMEKTLKELFDTVEEKVEHINSFKY